MKKKYALTGLSIAVGGVMLVTSAFASATGSTGYDTYKSAIKSTLTSKNFTENGTIIVKDNGKEFSNINNTIKENTAKESLSQNTVIKIGGQTKTLETYWQDGKTVSKDSTSNIYSVRTINKNKKFNGNKAEIGKIDSSKLNDGEMLLDALVGNLQNYVTLDSKEDGTKDVAITLTDSQIPAVANAAASILVKNLANNDNEMGREKDFSSLKKDIVGSIPKLESDIRIDNVSLKAEISKDNYITSQVADVSISGKDAEGIVHAITLDLNLNLSQFNNTTPDKVDLTGKQVKSITNKEGFRHGNKDEQDD
ncbi:MAG: hypothetical protein Q8942_06535 [Bacillota bacterium]|nr:hypothetical protein [Bacillota bacterium]